MGRKVVEQWLLKLIIKRWCAKSGITGTDFETAYLAWSKLPGHVDGIRVRTVVEHHIRQN